jgi:glycosyltransferase involved in cell wall biosynthesis
MRILFVSHDAQRAGAQNMLLGLLKWFKAKHTNVYFEVLFAKAGPLFPEFNVLAKCHLYPRNSRSNSIFVLKYLEFARKLLIRKLVQSKFSLIYFNSAMCAELIGKLSHLDALKITHVHELAYWLNRLTETESINLRRFTDHYFVPSHIVYQTLQKRGIAESSKISVVNVFVDINNLLLVDTLFSLKQLLGLSNNAVLIGACGTEDLRKGKDLFVEIAERSLRLISDQNIHFIWIGGVLKGAIANSYSESLFKDRIHFIDELPHAAKYFHEFYLFMMLSREDPFPTVNLEVGIHQVPIVYFAGTGGTEDLVGSKGGLRVNNGDLPGFVNALVSLLNNRPLRDRKGTWLAIKIKNNFAIDLIAENIWAKIKWVTSGGSSTNANN